jgi:hypothetical protein
MIPAVPKTDPHNMKSGFSSISSPVNGLIRPYLRALPFNEPRVSWQRRCGGHSLRHPNGKVTTDGIGPHNDLLTEFPYLGPPHRAAGTRLTV